MSEAITESKHLMSEAITDHQRSSEAKERRRGTRQWVVCMQDSLGLALYAGWPEARVACRMAPGLACRLAMRSNAGPRAGAPGVSSRSSRGATNHEATRRTAAERPRSSGAFLPPWCTAT